MLQKKNIEVSWAEYFQVGWRLTLPVLFAALAALCVLSLWLIRQMYIRRIQ